MSKDLFFQQREEEHYNEYQLRNMKGTLRFNGLDHDYVASLSDAEVIREYKKVKKL